MGGKVTRVDGDDDKEDLSKPCQLQKQSHYAQILMDMPMPTPVVNHPPFAVG